MWLENLFIDPELDCNRGKAIESVADNADGQVADNSGGLTL